MYYVLYPFICYVRVMWVISMYCSLMVPMHAVYTLMRVCIAYAVYLIYMLYICDAPVCGCIYVLYAIIYAIYIYIYIYTYIYIYICMCYAGVLCVKWVYTYML